MKYLVYEIPATDDLHASMLVDEIYTLLGVRPVSTRDVDTPAVPEPLPGSPGRPDIPAEFIAWADAYFYRPDHRNTRIARRELYDDYLTHYPGQRKFCTATTFKRHLIHYCRLRGYLLNPQLRDPVSHLPYTDNAGDPVIDDKSSGVEYFSIGDVRCLAPGIVL